MDFKISDSQYIEILDQEGRVVALSPIEEFRAIVTDSAAAPDIKAERIRKAQESRQERFDALLERIITTTTPAYLSIQIPGHFTLLAIDPASKTYRYIDSLHCSRNGDFKEELIFKEGEPEEGETYNAQKDLFSFLRNSLTTQGFRPSNHQYLSQQHSLEIESELRRRAIKETSSLRGVTDIEKLEMLRDLEDNAHNNECGFLVSYNIALMASAAGIRTEFVDETGEPDLFIYTFDSSLFLPGTSADAEASDKTISFPSLRDFFTKIFQEVKKDKILQVEEKEESMPETSSNEGLGAYGAGCAAGDKAVTGHDKPPERTAGASAVAVKFNTEQARQ
jgi:hypothetical protein